MGYRPWRHSLAWPNMHTLTRGLEAQEKSFGTRGKAKVFRHDTKITIHKRKKKMTNGMSSKLKTFVL